MRSTLMLCWILALVACATVPGTPETTYYRLPDVAALERLPAPVVDLPIVVEVFSADGLYADQALIHALDAGADQLRTYHYQLWIDPPTRLLQRRLIEVLRAGGVAAVVTDRLPTQLPTLRVQGRIARLERIPAHDGWEVAVTLVLRAEPSAGGRPWIIGEYRQRLAADGPRVADSVRAYGLALDRIGSEFMADLVAQAGAREASPGAMRLKQQGGAGMGIE